MGQATRQSSRDLRRTLSLSAWYDLVQVLSGARSGLEKIVHDHVRAREGDRVLDIGCGTALILDHLPNVRYVGFDVSERYIASARKRHGHHATFTCGNVSSVTLRGLQPFAVVLAIGVLHHLTDEEGVKLLELAWTAMEDGGRLVTVDPCYTRDSSWIAARMMRWDRGRFVRTEDGYTTLASKVFSRMNAVVRHDISRLPYTHIILECTK